MYLAEVACAGGVDIRIPVERACISRGTPDRLPVVLTVTMIEVFTKL